MKTEGPKPPKRAIITNKGNVYERFSRWSEEQHRYEFSLEDFTLCPQV